MNRMHIFLMTQDHSYAFQLLFSMVMPLGYVEFCRTVFLFVVVQVNKHSVSPCFQAVCEGTEK